MTFFVNGRTWAGAQPRQDHTGGFDAMQAAVEDIQRGDTLYLAAWMFQPSLALTRTTAGKNKLGNGTWGELYQTQARNGVKVRVIMKDFNPIAEKQHELLYKWFIPDLDKLIGGLPAAARDNIKYIVSN